VIFAISALAIAICNCHN